MNREWQPPPPLNNSNTVPVNHLNCTTEMIIISGSRHTKTIRTFKHVGNYVVTTFKIQQTIMSKVEKNQVSQLDDSTW